MKALKLFLIALSAQLAFTACSNSKNRPIEELSDNRDTYELIELETYRFRRAYYGHNTLDGADLEVFMNRNPEGEDYTNSRDYPFYSALCKTGLFLDGNLNLKEIDTLPKSFSLQVSENNFLKVETNLLVDPKVVKTPSYELTFTEKNKVVLKDTLAFDWIQVLFMTRDVDNDGTEELISICQWYIMNGDNFDVKIYRLKK